MATNDFKPFAVGGSANVISQTTYAANGALLANGFQVGIADPAVLNKVWRQASVMAAALGEFILAQTGANVVDDGTTPALVTGLSASVKSTVAAVQASTTAIPTTGGTVTLTATQAAAQYIVVSGVLTADANLVFPAAYRDYVVINNTTGAFAVNAKCAGGGGVPIFQGSADSVFCDGANVRYIEMSGITRTFGDSSKACATTEFVQNALAPVAALAGDSRFFYFAQL